MNLGVIDLIGAANFLDVHAADAAITAWAATMILRFVVTRATCGVEQFLLGVEHVEQRALADFFFFAHTVERCAEGRDLGIIAVELRLGGLNCDQVATTWPGFPGGSARFPECG